MLAEASRGREPAEPPLDERAQRGVERIVGLRKDQRELGRLLALSNRAYGTSMQRARPSGST